MDQTASVDLRAVGEAFWKEANLKYPREIASIQIEELSLTGNMPITELQKRKIDWKTEDDYKLSYSAVEDQSDDVKALNPMQIRVFSITVEPATSESLTDTEDETFIII